MRAALCMREREPILFPVLVSTAISLVFATFVNRQVLTSVIFIPKIVQFMSAKCSKFFPMISGTYCNPIKLKRCAYF